MSPSCKRKALSVQASIDRLGAREGGAKYNREN